MHILITSFHEIHPVFKFSSNAAILPDTTKYKKKEANINCSHFTSYINCYKETAIVNEELKKLKNAISLVNEGNYNTFK